MAYKSCEIPQILHLPKRQGQNDRNNKLIFKSVIKTFCWKKKPLSILTLCAYVQDDLKEYGKITPETIVDLLLKYSKNFTVVKSDANPGSSLVSLKSVVHFCEKNWKKHSQCPGSPFCQGLHICKYFFLFDSCHILGSTCKYGHDLYSPHNYRILVDNGIEELTINELRYLASTNDKQITLTLPQICCYYNSEGGCNYASKGERCHYLHLCKYYILDQCRFGRKKCKRNHNIDDEVLEILSRHGINIQRPKTEILRELKNHASGFGERSTNTFPGDSRTLSQPESDSTIEDLNQKPILDEVTTIICVYYLQEKCTFRTKCHNHHKKLPFQWQFKANDMESTWEDINLDSNIDLEIKYSDPNNDEAKVKYNKTEILTANFGDMVARNSQGKMLMLRRLSTLSSGGREKISPYDTTWLWYWKRENNYIEYGKKVTEDTNYVPNSIDLEKSYLENPNGEFTFRSGKFNYVLDFHKMTQKNTSLGTSREVKRRPKFKHTLTLKENPTMGLKDHPCNIPPQWSFHEKALPQLTFINHYVVAEIQDNPCCVSELVDIEELFYKTMKTHKITRIKRVENGDLWMNFASKKEKMKLKRNGIDAEERRLFHGTASGNIDAICHQGFDFRFSGRAVGTKYGKGSYFATEAKYSDAYCSSSDEKSMFLAKVLVGDYSIGNPLYVRPPPRFPGNASELFDSCVDREIDPLIYVIFTNEQAYPEYIISYKTMQ